VPTTYFKKCSKCNKKWTSPSEYVEGTVEVSHCDSFGLSLRNCSCGTTLGCWADCLYEVEISPIATRLRAAGQPSGNICNGCPYKNTCNRKEIPVHKTKEIKE